MKVTQLLDLQGPSRCQVCREMDCLPNKSYDPAAAAKLLQSCPTLRNPIDGSPPGSPIPGILQARTLEWVAISFSSYGPIRAIFPASCSRRSEVLFGQSFSVAPPIQALRGLPCLRSFCVVLHVRHIEGSSWLGSYSVDWWVRHLKGHPGWGPAL